MCPPKTGPDAALSDNRALGSLPFLAVAGCRLSAVHDGAVVVIKISFSLA